METYWCCIKNDVREPLSHREIPIALTPCRMSECGNWRDGECIQIRKAGKPDHPQVFSRVNPEESTKKPSANHPAFYR